MSGRGAERVLELLEWFASVHTPVSLDAVTKALTLPKSSALLLLRTLVRHRYVERVSDGRYRLIRLPGEVASETNAWGTIRRVVEPFVAAAVREVEESGFVAVLKDRKVIHYLCKILPRQELPYDRDISTLRTAHHVASGIVLLAGLPSADIDTYLAACDAVAPDSSDHPDNIRRKIHQTQTDGYFVNLHGRVEGAAGVAAPVTAADGRTVAAINIAGPRDRVASNCDRLIRATVDAARAASQEMTRRFSVRPAEGKDLQSKPEFEGA